MELKRAAEIVIELAQSGQLDLKEAQQDPDVLLPMVYEQDIAIKTLLIFFKEFLDEGKVRVTPKTIVVEVRGGLVEDITGIPDGIQVEVRDYDVQDAGESQETDSEGYKYRSEIWG